MQSLASMYVTANWYIAKRPEAKSTEPMMSVAQWTPETSLPTTIRSENATTNTVTTFLSTKLPDLLCTWNSSVGITLNTNSVVEDG